MRLNLFTLPPAIYGGYNFSTSSSTFLVTCFFGYSHPSGYAGISQCGFDLYFPDGYLQDLLCVYWPFVYLLCRNIYSNFLPNFKILRVLVRWLLKGKSSLYILDECSLTVYDFLKHIVPFVVFSLYFLDSTLGSTKVHEFDKIYVFLLSIVLLVRYIERFHIPMILWYN